MTVYTITWPILDNEYLRVPVSATNNGVSVNPTADVVQMALMTAGAQPTAPDWKAASWETDSTTTPPTYYARAIPPQLISLAQGTTYTIWLKIIDSPETVVRTVGELVVW